MREPLDNGAPRHYERPNQSWICGLASEGQTCPAGPTAGGKCPALAVCMPVRDGDRWRCNRSPLRGGPCDDGPTPQGGCSHVHRCEPVRNLRTKRVRFLVACALATSAALLIIVQSEFRDDFISPGPLARQHAQLVGTGQCSACHAAANEGMSGWMASLAVGHRDAPSQSQRCMECHGKDFSRELARSAHNLPQETLAKITAARGRNISRGLLSRVVNAVFVSRPNEPACAACHQEHRGTDRDLTAIDNSSCQACHHDRYQSFADDHPDFGGWPYERRTRIIFDHVAHQAKHFAEKKRPFDCQTCHVADATHMVERLANYDRACASCHDEKIRTGVGQGVPMLALPTLDVNAFRKAGLDIGTWPASATGDFDGRMPPIMKLLLAGDPQAAAALAKLGPSFEFSDLDANNVERLREGAAVAQAIERLLSDLSQNAPSSVRTRLQTAIGSDVSEVELRPLLAGLSADTIRSATKSWLPNADVGTKEWVDAMGSGFRVQDSETKIPIPGPRPLNPESSAEPRPLNPEPSYSLAGTWSRDDRALTIRYRLAAHADPVLASWLSLVVNTPKIDERPLLSAIVKEMSKPTAPGQCASCHSLEQTSVGTLAINWRPFDRTNELRTFTKFSHGPHLRLPQLADCTACHALDPQANTTASYADNDPHRFVSEFQPLSKQKCAECHTAAAAGDSCQSCHRYHVETADARFLPPSPFPIPPSLKTSNETRPARR